MMEPHTLLKAHTSLPISHTHINTIVGHNVQGITQLLQFESHLMLWLLVKAVQTHSIPFVYNGSILLGIFEKSGPTYRPPWTYCGPRGQNQCPRKAIPLDVGKCFSRLYQAKTNP
jgi:hypothetical protein